MPLPLAAQAPAIIAMSEEPHHHLALHNDCVNVYNAEAAPGDSLLLRRHMHDAVAIAVGDHTVTVGIPCKAEVHAKNADGQVRMQVRGYVHSTRNDGLSAYRIVAIELLQPQTGERNLCATVVPGKPMNSPDGAPPAWPSERTAVPQFASTETRIETVHLPAHQNAKIAGARESELLVALDSASISPALGSGPDQTLRAGEILWFDASAPARILKNGSDSEVRFVELRFQDSVPAKSASVATSPAN